MAYVAKVAFVNANGTINQDEIFDNEADAESRAADLVANQPWINGGVYPAIVPVTVWSE